MALIPLKVRAGTAALTFAAAMMTPFVSVLLATPVRAAAFSYSEDIDKFGLQPNFTCQSGGICAAVAAINSFIFLENQYSDIYRLDPVRPTVLTPFRQENSKTDPIDAGRFADFGWTAPDGTKRPGYYQRSGGDPDQRLAVTKMEWINDFAPGTTLFSSMARPGIDYLSTEIKKGEDVEFTIRSGTGIAHALTLTGIACGAMRDCTITYLDPNNITNPDGSPNNIQSAISQQGDRLRFMYRSDDTLVNVGIDFAFSQSPVPGPIAGAGLPGAWARARGARCKAAV